MFREKKTDASETLWKHALLKPENSAASSELKAFNTERPSDCVGGWAEQQHCIGRPGRDILTVGEL